MKRLLIAGLLLSLWLVPAYGSDFVIGPWYRFARFHVITTSPINRGMKYKPVETITDYVIIHSTTANDTTDITIYQHYGAAADSINFSVFCRAAGTSFFALPFKIPADSLRVRHSAVSSFTYVLVKK